MESSADDPDDPDDPDSDGSDGCGGDPRESEGDGPVDDAPGEEDSEDEGSEDEGSEDEASEVSGLATAIGIPTEARNVIPRPADNTARRHAVDIRAFKLRVNSGQAWS